MKKIMFLVAFVFAQVSLAESLSVNLSADGLFKKTKSIMVSDYSSKKACRADKGRWFGRGRCLMQNTTASVILEKSEFSDTYKVKVENFSADGKSCTFEGIGGYINQVQLLAVTEQCHLTVGFTGQNTLSTWTSGDCNCQEGSSLKVDDVKRTSPIKR